MQPFEGTAAYVKLILEEEYKLLCQCHGFKAAFDKHALSQKAESIPGESIHFPIV